MFGYVRVELVEPQCFLAMDDIDARQYNRGDYCTLSPADGAVTSARVDDSIRQIEFNNDRAAMAGKPMFREDGDTTDGLDHACLARSSDSEA